MDKYNISQPIRLKKGVYQLNEERNFDYQLNRVINWDGGRLEDVKPIAGRIRTSSDWKRELIALGDKAMKEGRTQNAIAYYRMSEFFMYDGDPDNHCNVGNGEIVLDAICNWIQSIDNESDKL